MEMVTIMELYHPKFKQKAKVKEVTNGFQKGEIYLFQFFLLLIKNFI